MPRPPLMSTVVPKLSAADRRLLCMLYHDALTDAEVAKVLSISPSEAGRRRRSLVRRIRAMWLAIKSK